MLPSRLLSTKAINKEKKDYFQLYFDMAPSLNLVVSGADLRRLTQQNGWDDDAATTAIKGLAQFDMSAACAKAMDLDKVTGRCNFTDIDNWQLCVTVKTKFIRRFAFQVTVRVR